MKLKKFSFKKCLVLLLLFLSPLSVWAESSVVTLEEGRKHYSLGRSLYILEDRNGDVTIDGIMKHQYDSRFTRSEADAPNYGFSRSTYWAKFEIINPFNTPREMYLETGYPNLDLIELYMPEPGGRYQKRTAGYNYVFKEREVQYRNIVFKISLSPGKNTYYAMIQSSGTVTFPLILQTPDYLVETSTIDYLVLGMYYGILFVMILYNLFVYISVRDRSYLYYISYITSFILFSFSLNGMGFQNFWPDSIWWQKVSVPLLIFSGIFTIGQFVRSFLELKKISAVSDRIVQLMMLMAFAGMVLSFIIDYSMAIRLSALTVVIAVTICFLVGIFSVIKGNRSARFYLLAWTCFLLGCFVFALKATGYIPFNTVTQYAMQAGSAAEVVLLSFALGDRINILKGEKETAQLRTIEIQKSATEDLERKVAERTMELNRANEDLKELDKLKSNFFANISHEIRTPLTLILSPVESVLQGDYGREVDNSFFENVQRNAIKLLKLINNLLDFSKIEAGHMNLNIKEIDIVIFIRNYITAIHSAAESKGISLSFVTLSSAIRLHIDIEKMDKIVMNLFSNALKFTDKGGFIRILVKEDDKNCYIIFEDSGIGIPRDKYETIFDRFSQVDTGSTRKYEGTGIGLALVKEFVNMHGGTLTVESRFIDETPEDHGTTFTVTIPRGKEHLQENDNIHISEGSELEESVSDYSFAGMREMTDLRFEKESRHVAEYNNHDYGTDILVVEDNPDMQNFLKFILQKYYNVYIAGNGEEGIKTASVLKPALIVSDVMMPVMNGYEMTKRIKEDELLKRTPVILLTAKSEISSKIEGIEYGADDYLTKPFNSKELLTRIRMLLKTRNYEYAIEKRNNEIEEDLKIARMIQHRLLPQNIPDIAGYKFHSTYIPMDKVGGDFYDFKENGNSIEVFIADVSGHGLVSAFISMIAKMAYDSIYVKSSCTHVLYQLNDILCNSTVNSIYMTTFFCLIDRETRILKYANAGHFYPLLYRKTTGEFFELEAKGKPLGWFEDLQLVEKQIHLEEGDRVVFYTDGITECMDAGNQFFGEERFKDFILENSHMEPDMFSARLINELKDFCSSDKFNDDLCLLVLDVC
ncbi:MAG TPA: 7TM diverse intracellular signaling domain-containing protein [Spirochaetota bacterium]|nr:7TM diverse intracellular signaling domain-containing protein [Spirochaetota bacterium]